MPNGKKRPIAVVLILETDDPRLDPDQIDVSTVESTARLREGVIANLRNLTRVVAVMDEESARRMMYANDVASRALGVQVHHPPAGYKPPDCKL